MLTERIRSIKYIIDDAERVKSCIPFQTTPYKPDYSRPIILRKAYAVAAMLDYIDTPHMKGTRLAGCGSYLFTPPPEYLSKDELEEIKKYPKSCPRELMDSLDEMIFCLVPYLAGHISVDQTFIVKHGIEGMLSTLRDKLKDETLSTDQQNFLQAAIIEWEACIRYANRYSKFYEKLAREESDPKLKKEYKLISDCIAKVPAKPADTYVEALQSMWFMYRCVHADDRSGHSFGRMDQLIYPYYKRDISAGVITEEEAGEYFYDFWLKFCAGHSIVETEGDKFVLAGDDEDDSLKGYHNGLFWPNSYSFITERHVDDGYPFNISGEDSKGNDVTNEISWLVLRALHDLNTVSVKPVLKYTNNVNKEFVNECYKSILTGKALPAIAFDDNMREALRMEPENHYTEEDLLSVSNIGCIELAIPGKSYTDAMNCFMNLPKIFVITLNNGYYNGKRMGLILNEPKTFTELKENYYKQLEYFIRLYEQGQNAAAQFYNKYYMRPLASTLIEGCIENAQLLDEGGARYWSKTMNCCGIADTADALMAVKKVVFDDEQMSLTDLNKILNNNFKDKEIFRQYLINKVPKYGNDVSEVDELAKFVVDSFCQLVSQCRTWNGRVYRPGLYSFYGSIINMAAVTSALPNGRRNGDIYALNISPEHGCMKNGITAALRSITSFDHRQAMNACPVDVQLSPNTPVDVVDNITKYLDKNNALLLQIGVASREDMIEAQKHPEKYQDLIVRVSGFSARFVVLDKSVQDEIILRSFWT